MVKLDTNEVDLKFYATTSLILDLAVREIKRIQASCTLFPERVTHDLRAASRAFRFTVQFGHNNQVLLPQALSPIQPVLLAHSCPVNRDRDHDKGSEQWSGFSTHPRSTIGIWRTTAILRRS